MRRAACDGAPDAPRCAQGRVRGGSVAEPERYNEKCGVLGIFNVQKVLPPGRCARERGDALPKRTRRPVRMVPALRAGCRVIFRG